MVIDIGGGTTEIAVLSLNGVVEAKSLRVGGDRFDESIVSYVRKTHSTLIGDSTAERIKQSIAIAHPAIESSEMQVSGRDMSRWNPNKL